MEKRAMFLVSTEGQGHLVRSRALMAELVGRRWRASMTTEQGCPRSAASYDVTVFDVGHVPSREMLDAVKERPVVVVLDVPTRSIDLDEHADLVVCGSAGAKAIEFGLVFAEALVGPQYALLRPEFREMRSDAWKFQSSSGNVMNYAPTLTASQMATEMLYHGRLTVNGGMRAMEAACVRGCAGRLDIVVRNYGEALNAAGLLLDPEADLVDGLGCQRVADAIEAL